MQHSLSCAATTTARPARQAIGYANRAPRRSLWRSRAERNGGEPVVGEDLLARLRQAEEEAAALRQELAKAQGDSPAAALDSQGEEEDSKLASRIDGGDLRRETLFTVESQQRNWLNESDVAFFTGGGPGEDLSASASAEEQATVRRRLLLGTLATVALGAFALVPTAQLNLAPPSKPAFFYLVALLRVQALLAQAEAAVPEGDYTQLKAILRRIEGEPNQVQQNLRDAAATLPTSREVEAAESVGRDCYEYVKQIDYNQYYDSLRVADGETQKRYYEFSLQAAKAAQAKLLEFLALMPRDQLQAARDQLATPMF